MSNSSYCDDLLQQIRDLTQTNESLKEANDNFQQQYNEALNLVQQMEPLSAKNQQLSKELREIRIERDDYARRLEIVLQRNEECNKPKEASDTVNIAASNQEISKLKNELSRIKLENQQHIQQYQLEVTNLQSQLESEQINSKKLANTLKSIVNSSSYYFNTSFRSASQLNEYLANPNNNGHDKSEEDSKTHTENCDQCYIFAKKLKKAKQTIKNGNKENQNLLLKISTLQKQLDNQKVEYAQMISQADSRINEAEHNIKMVEAQNQQALTEKEEKIAQIEAYCSKQKDKVHALKQQLIEKLKFSQSDDSELYDMNTKISTLAAQLSSAQEAVVMLKKQNSLLVTQLTGTSTLKSSYTSQYEELNSKYAKKMQEYGALETENSNLKIKLHEIEEKYATCVSQVQAAKSSFKQTEIAVTQAESRTAQAVSAVKLLEKTIDNQKQEISHFYKDRDVILSLLSKHNSLLKQYEEKTIQLEANNNKLQKKLSEQLAIQENQVPEPEEIPITSWNSPEFPGDLSSIIHDIASNENLPINAKLRHVFLAIARYYNIRYNELTEQYQQVHDIYEQNSETIDQFVCSLGTIAGESLNLSTILEEPAKRDILISKISSTYDRFIDLTEKHNHTATNLNELIKSLKSDSLPRAKETVLELYTSIEELTEQCDALRKKLKHIKKDNHFISDQFKQDNLTNQEYIEHLKTSYSSLNDEKNSLTEELHEAQHQILKLNEEIKKQKSQNSMVISEAQSEYEKELTEVNALHYNEINDLNDKIHAKENALSQAEQRIAQYEYEVSQWKRTIELLQAEKKSRDNQIQSLQSQLDQKCRELSDQSTQEKNSITLRYEAVVEQLKQKNKELRDLTQKLTVALDESELRHKSIIQNNTELQIKVQNLNAKLNSMNEMNHRQKQLVETKLKAVSLSAETRANNLIEDLRTQFDIEKREIYSEVISNFRAFYDARKSLNEEGFKTLLHSVNTELARLTKQEAQIRRLLGLGPNESPETAISSLLVSLYEH